MFTICYDRMRDIWNDLSLNSFQSKIRKVKMREIAVMRKMMRKIALRHEMMRKIEFSHC